MNPWWSAAALVLLAGAVAAAVHVLDTINGRPERNRDDRGK